MDFYDPKVIAAFSSVCAMLGTGLFRFLERYVEGKRKDRREDHEERWRMMDRLMEEQSEFRNQIAVELGQVRVALRTCEEGRTKDQESWTKQMNEMRADYQSLLVKLQTAQKEG